MPLTKLKFNPGIMKEITPYSNEGGWLDCDKVRFRFGYPEKIGGWQKKIEADYQGTARTLLPAVALDGTLRTGVGTTFKYYIEQGSSFNDVTPLRVTTSAGDVTFSATDGQSTITVTDTAHGAVDSDFVTFSGAATLGGNVTAAVLNKEHQITSVTDVSTYVITLSVTANSSDTGNGGSSTVGAYQVNVGLDAAFQGNGYGSGSWGGQTSTATETTLGAAITDTSTGSATLTVTDETGFHTGGVASAGNLQTVPAALTGSGTAVTSNYTIMIGGELMVLTPNTDNNSLEVNRNSDHGANNGATGSTLSTHSNGAKVFLAIGNSNTDNDFTGWGVAAASTTATTQELRTWSHTKFGEDFIINARNGNIYYWDASEGIQTRAQTLYAEGGSSDANTPSIAKQVMVTTQDRHLIAFGCNASQTGDQDPLLIRFSDQEAPFTWTEAATNSAGSLRLTNGSEFVTAIETKQQIIVLTDTAVFSMQFIGAPFTFGLNQLSTNVSIAGPLAAINYENAVIWMGKGEFYIYDGRVIKLPCSLRNYVFKDKKFGLNLNQADKVVAGMNTSYSEVWWFYPSNLDDNGVGNKENNRYIIYNYEQKVWYHGSLSRTAWVDEGVFPYPVGAGQATDGDHYLYQHEIGHDDDGTAMAAHIESSQFDIAEGDKFAFVRKIIPDLTFNPSESSSPAVTLTVKARRYPGTKSLESDTGGVTQTTSSDINAQVVSSTIEEFTEKIDVRLRGRSVAFRIESSTGDTYWRLGSPRLDIRPDGGR